MMQSGEEHLDLNTALIFCVSGSKMKYISEVSRQL